MFNGVSFLILPVWCSEHILYLDDPLFIKTGEIFCYYFIEYVFYAFSLYLFSFF
jgi:hypothetical protein